MKITKVFPLIEEKKIYMDPDLVLGNIVNRPEYVRAQKERGIEPPLIIQEGVRSALEQVLKTQGQAGWWKSLDKEALLRHPALEEWQGNPELDKVVHRALIEISGAAARSLWSSLAGEDIGEVVKDKLDEGNIVGSTTVQNQYDTLAKIAARELGSEYGRSYEEK